jgi:oligosaccharyltransferase complex subunit delta (ribophorin II)
MRFTQSIAPALLLLAAGAAQAASAWGFDDGSVQIAAKKAGESVKEKYAAPH